MSTFNLGATLNSESSDMMSARFLDAAIHITASCAHGLGASNTSVLLEIINDKLIELYYKNIEVIRTKNTEQKVQGVKNTIQVQAASKEDSLEDFVLQELEKFNNTIWKKRQEKKA